MIVGWLGRVTVLRHEFEVPKVARQCRPERSFDFAQDKLSLVRPSTAVILEDAESCLYAGFATHADPGNRSLHFAFRGES